MDKVHAEGLRGVSTLALREIRETHFAVELQGLLRVLDTNHRVVELVKYQCSEWFRTRKGPTL